MTDSERDGSTTDGPDFDANSILSHGEREVARRLHENPDATPEAIAEARGTDAVAVEKSIERIREKTVRALATLDQSPFADELAGEAPDPARRVAAVLGGEDAEGSDD